MKIKATLPKGDSDGLSPIEAVVVKQQKPVVALVILEPVKIDEDLKTREKEVVFGIRRVEALLADDVEAATRLLQRAFESRTGESTLPIDLEDDIRDALKGVDKYVPETQTVEEIEVPEGDYSKLTITKLTALLKSRKLDHSKGTKTELIGRLEAADAGLTETPSNVTSLFNDGSAPVEEDIAAEVVDEDDAAWEAAAPTVDDVPAEEFTVDPDDEYEVSPDDYDDPEPA